LDRPFREISQAFPGKLRAYLRRHASDQLTPMATDAFVAVCRRELGARAGLSERDYTVMARLIREATDRDLGRTYQLREEGELLAVGFYPELAGRTINLIAASTDRGRKRRGMARLLSLVMAGRCGRAGAVMDFEGSEIPGVRRFFEKFGATDEGYWLIEEKAFGLLT
jgi:hypothetical protein